MLPARHSLGRRATVVVAALAMVASACGAQSAAGPDGSAATSAPGPAPTLAQQSMTMSTTATAQALAADYLESVLDEIDPPHLAALAYLYRNWDVPQLSTADSRARAGLARQLDGTAEVVSPDALEFARWIDPALRQPLVDRAGERSETSVVMAAGLYCDVVGVSPEEIAVMEQLVAEGGYGATHVLLGYAWATEVGCDDPALVDVGQRSVERVANEFIERIVTSPVLRTAIDDLFLEQGAFLALVGRTNLLTQGWLQAVVDSQLPGGGWAAVSVDDAGVPEPDWHATLLALWAMLAADSPGGAGQPMVVT
jgi:hypothetical protein